MTNTNLKNKTSSYTNNNCQNSAKNPLTIINNPNNLTVPENPKECPAYIAVCDGILKTAGEMLKQLNKQDEQYNAIIKLSWQYAILRLKAQYNLGKYFSKIEGAQGTHPKIDKSGEELLFSEEKKPTKEQILKDEYNQTYINWFTNSARF